MLDGSVLGFLDLFVGGEGDGIGSVCVLQPIPEDGQLGDQALLLLDQFVHLLEKGEIVLLDVGGRNLAGFEHRSEAGDGLLDARDLAAEVVEPIGETGSGFHQGREARLEVVLLIPGVAVGREFIGQGIEDGPRSGRGIVGHEEVDVVVVGQGPGCVVHLEFRRCAESGEEALIFLLDALVLCFHLTQKGIGLQLSCVAGNPVHDGIARDGRGGLLQDVLEQAFDKLGDLVAVADVFVMDGEDIAEGIRRGGLSFVVGVIGDGDSVLLDELVDVDVENGLSLLIDILLDDFLDVALGDDVIEGIVAAIEIGDSLKGTVLRIGGLDGKAELDAGSGDLMPGVPIKGEDQISDDGEDQADSQDPVFEEVDLMAIVAPGEVLLCVFVLLDDDDLVIVFVHVL